MYYQTKNFEKCLIVLFFRICLQGLQKKKVRSISKSPNRPNNPLPRTPLIHHWIKQLAPKPIPERTTPPPIYVWVIKEEFVILHTEFKRRVGVHFGQNAAKNNDLLKKNALNESFSEFNFLQKTQRTRVSISPWSGARGLQRSPFFKYFSALEWKKTFTLGLKATKNT